MFLRSIVNCIKFSIINKPLFIKNTKRSLSISNVLCQQDDTETLQEDDSLLKDESYYEAFPEISSRTLRSHTVLVIQPNMKDVPEKTKITSAALQLAEICALVESIPDWKIVDKCMHSLKRVNPGRVFGKGKLEELTDYVRSNSSKISAVVVGMNTLNTAQLSYLQDLWRFPVYDRYTLILEIFRSRAITREAKLQVSLAEINYLRSRLYGMHKNTLDYQKEGLEHIGGLGETTLDNRKMLLKNKEASIMKEIERIGNNRQIIRENRKKLDIPTVAVVGYTNAGKTSLIKSLTGITKLAPKNQLFATLDVTSFEGYLPNRMKVLYLDTVGFISNIPPSLQSAFNVTLADVSNADLLVHVSDASHPDKKAQDVVVKETIASLPSVPQHLIDNVVCVHNKVDLLDEKERDELESMTQSQVLMSVKEGSGRQELMLQIQDALMKSTGRVIKMLRVPAGGTMLAWLYKEATVEQVVPDEKDPEMYLVKAMMSVSTLSKFNHIYRKK